MYSPTDLVNDTPEIMREKLERLHDQIGDCRIILTDIEAGTPNQAVTDFYRIAAELWETSPDQLVPA